MKQEHILVTGGAGYIGSILVPFLLQKGYKVTVIDNLMYRQETLWECFSNSNFQFIKGDVNNEDLLCKVLPYIDIVIPLAALVGATTCKLFPALAKLVNYDAIQIMINCSGPNHKIIFPSTNSVYGVGKKNELCTEKSTVNPISHYGRLKVEVEKELLASNRAICLRLATVFGVSPRMRLDLIVNDYTYRACRDGYIVLYEGHLKRNHVHIQDVARAFLFSINNFDEMRGEIFNIGSADVNLSKKELCEKIKNYVPSFYIHDAIQREDADKRDYIVSNKKIESLGWATKKNLDDGIQDLIRAYDIVCRNQFVN